MSKLDWVVITGAGRGIGRAAALDIGTTGTSVLCLSKTATCKDTAREIRTKGGTAEHMKMDLSNYQAVHHSLSEWAASKSGKFGAVLAGAILGPTGPFEDSSLEGWDLVYRTNVLGNVAVAQSLTKKFKESGCGRVVMFAGGGAAYAYPEFPAYSASKTAMVRVAENLHEDLKHLEDFAAVIIAPGAVETDMLKSVRDAGGVIKTTVDISEPVTFIREFLSSTSCPFSGRFLHVRDIWKELLNTDKQISKEDLWKLRRIEDKRSG